MVSSQGKIKVLFIEDDEAYAYLIKSIFKKTNFLDFDLLQAKSLNEAFNVLSSQVKIDVILLDLMLPDGDGLDSLARMLAIAGTVPIIVLSCVDDEELALKAVKQGAQDYLVKGQADISTVKRSIRYAIERKQLIEKIRESLKDKESLLNEVHHRVKNNLQVVSSLLSLQSRYTKDPKVLAVFKDCRNRIISMALVHEKLYRSSNLSRVKLRDYVQSLAQHLLCSYLKGPEDLSIDIDIDSERSFAVDIAVPCGLILNELISNSLRHAFPNGGVGTIRVELKTFGKGNIVLAVKDNGIGLPKDFQISKLEESQFESGTIGLKIVDMLARQLNGSLVAKNGTGTSMEVEFPDPALIDSGLEYRGLTSLLRD
jgi:two-component sensor histidine kinase